MFLFLCDQKINSSCDQSMLNWDVDAEFPPLSKKMAKTKEQIIHLKNQPDIDVFNKNLRNSLEVSHPNSSSYKEKTFKFLETPRTKFHKNTEPENIDPGQKDEMSKSLLSKTQGRVKFLDRCKHADGQNIILGKPETSSTTTLATIQSERQKGIQITTNTSSLSKPKNSHIDFGDLEFVNADQIPPQNKSSKPNLRKLRAKHLCEVMKNKPKKSTKQNFQTQAHFPLRKKLQDVFSKLIYPIKIISSMVPINTQSLDWIKTEIKNLLLAETWSKEALRKHPRSLKGNQIIKEDSRGRTQDKTQQIVKSREKKLMEGEVPVYSENMTVVKDLTNKRSNKKKKKVKDQGLPSLNDIPGYNSGFDVDTLEKEKLKESWKNLGLNVEGMQILYNLMRIKNKKNWMRIEVSMNDYTTLTKKNEFSQHEEFTWLQSQSGISKREFDRRKEVVKFQLNQYHIVKRWEEVKLLGEIDPNIQLKIQRTFQMDQLWPVFFDQYKLNWEDYMTVTKACFTEEKLRSLMKEILGVEFDVRIHQIRTLSDRQGAPVWWNSDDLRDARRQGIDVRELVYLGDNLNFGKSTYDGQISIPPYLAKRTMENIYYHLENRLKGKTGYPLMSLDWAYSAEKAWIINHPQIYKLWKSRMKMLAIGCNSFIFVEEKRDQNGRDGTRAVWWFLGDLLRWIDEGIPTDAMHQVGIRLKFENTAHLTPEFVRGINWKTLLKGFDPHISQKIKKRLEEQSLWNEELYNFEYSQTIWKRFRGIFSNLSSPKWKTWPDVMVV